MANQTQVVDRAAIEQLMAERHFVPTWEHAGEWIQGNIDYKLWPTCRPSIAGESLERDTLLGCIQENKIFRDGREDSGFYDDNDWLDVIGEKEPITTLFLRLQREWGTLEISDEDIDIWYRYLEHCLKDIAPDTQHVTVQSIEEFSHIFEEYHQSHDQGEEYGFIRHEWLGYSASQHCLGEQRCDDGAHIRYYAPNGQVFWKISEAIEEAGYWGEEGDERNRENPDVGG